MSHSASGLGNIALHTMVTAGGRGGAIDVEDGRLYWPIVRMVSG